MRRPTRGGVALAALGVAPWTWFAVRDLDARLDALALAWPVVGAGVAVVLAASALLGRSRARAAVTASWLLATAVIVVAPWRPLDTGTPVESVRVVAANVFGGNTYAPGVSRELARERPDVLVVAEITDAATASLADDFARHGRPLDARGRAGDVAVFTDLPMRVGALPGGLGRQRGLRAEIDGPAGPFVLYALHLQKPGLRPSEVEVGFRTHRRLVDALAAAVEAESLPVVVAGDLNLADRTSGYRALTAVLDDGVRAGWVGPTSRKLLTRPLLARIDHVLMPEDWCAADGGTFTMRGSDHRGVAATIGPCR